jgi:hypothetical protein
MEEKHVKKAGISPIMRFLVPFFNEKWGCLIFVENIWISKSLNHSAIPDDCEGF